MSAAPRTAVKTPTPVDALLSRAERTPDMVAVIADGERWSCARLVAESARLADAMRIRGVAPGERVALHMRNRPELALAYLACWCIGAIAVPLNTRYKPPEIAAMLERVRPVLYLGEADLVKGLRTADAGLPPTEACFATGLEAGLNDARPWTELTADADGAPSKRPKTVDPDLPALLLATSGTTGPSKLAVFTLRTLGVLARSAEENGQGCDDVVLINTPMMHAAGATFFTACLLTGAVAVLIPQFAPEPVLDAIAEHRCTTFAGLPFMCSKVAHAQRSDPRDLRSLRLCMVGGDVCPDETAQTFEIAIGRALLSKWGATEDATLSLPAVRPGPFVRFRPEVEVRLVDAAGKSVAVDGSGEMLIRSAGTTPGYWQEPGQVEPLPDGWFHSGDLVRREPDGQLRYLGRTKDLIVRGGSNISPGEIEEALRRQAGVADVAVVGLPDAELGERVGAALVLAENTTAEALPGILADVGRELADYKIPDKVALVDTIPRNDLDKIDRRSVVEAVTKS